MDVPRSAQPAVGVPAFAGGAGGGADKGCRRRAAGGGRAALRGGVPRLGRLPQAQVHAPGQYPDRHQRDRRSADNFGSGAGRVLRVGGIDGARVRADPVARHALGLDRLADRTRLPGVLHPRREAAPRAQPRSDRRRRHGELRKNQHEVFPLVAPWHQVQRPHASRQLQHADGHREVRPRQHHLVARGLRLRDGRAAGG